MRKQALSRREEEIVELAIEGFTNDGIADKLNLSVGTVNTYWLRIRMKVGGFGRTDTVAKVLQHRAEREAVSVDDERQHMLESFGPRILEKRAALALLQLAMEQIQATVWATDTDLKIEVLANGEMPSHVGGVHWEIGKTIYEMFQTQDPKHPAVAAHLNALDGKETTVRLQRPYDHMALRTQPLRGEGDEIMGCIGVLQLHEDDES